MQLFYLVFLSGKRNNWAALFQAVFHQGSIQYNDTPTALLPSAPFISL
jgi:hypothetical protein